MDFIGYHLTAPIKTKYHDLCRGKCQTVALVQTKLTSFFVNGCWAHLLIWVYTFNVMRASVTKKNRGSGCQRRKKMTNWRVSICMRMYACYAWGFVTPFKKAPFAWVTSNEKTTLPHYRGECACEQHGRAPCVYFLPVSWVCACVCVCLCTCVLYVHSCWVCSNKVPEWPLPVPRV